MDIDRFLVSLLEELNTSDFVEKVDIQREVFIVKGRVILKKNRFLQVYYNEKTGTTAFALIDCGKRIWGVDCDNIRGWHIHPLKNPDSHINTDSMTINEIIQRLKDVWLIV